METMHIKKTWSMKRSKELAAFVATRHLVTGKRELEKTVHMHCDSKKGRLSDNKKVVMCLLVTRRYLGRAISCTKLASCTRLCVWSVLITMMMHIRILFSWYRESIKNILTMRSTTVYYIVVMHVIPTSPLFTLFHPSLWCCTYE